MQMKLVLIFTVKILLDYIKIFFDPSSHKAKKNWKKLFQKSRDEIKLYCVNFCKKYFNMEKLAE